MAEHGNGGHDRPRLLEDGTLHIPFECADHRYKYWKKEGMPITAILAELGAPREVWERYTDDPFPDDAPDPETARET